MRDLRSALLAAAGIVVLAMAIVYLVAPGVAQSLWPWPLSRLSRIFVASIFAASAVPVIWAGLSGELAAVAAGAIDLAVMYAAIAVYVLVHGAAEPSALVTWFGGTSALLALVMFALFIWSSRIPFKQDGPTPRPVYWSFGIFACILFAVAAALVFGRAYTFPWPLSRDTAATFGFIYLGAAIYFLHGMIRPVWGNAKGQLLGFLVYDAVLIPPFAMHFQTVQPAMLTSLTVYMSVLVVSAVIAIYYLFVHPATRFGSIAQVPQGAQNS